MKLLVRDLGLSAYEDTWQRMQTFTEQRTEDTFDEIWFVQHPSVFTLGKNGKPEHILNSPSIPIVNSDRGGQVTYHGPGQLVVYVLLDLARLKLGVRSLVSLLENSIIELLSLYDVEAYAKKDAPGVYVNEKKIAALGLRVKKGRCFHGLALNVAMDLAPYQSINPCGYEGLEITQLANLVESTDIATITQQIKTILTQNLSYTELIETD